MSETKTMGSALRYLKEGPVEILTRVTDFNIQTLKDPKTNQEHVFPANTLVAFQALSFRELPHEPWENAARAAGESSDRPTDRWEFVTTQEVNGVPVRAMIYLDGRDIFMVRAISKVL